MKDTALDVILQQGLLGAICVILMFVCWQLFKLYADAQNDKIVILKEALNTAAPLAEAIKELTRSHHTLAEKISEIEDARKRR